MTFRIIKAFAYSGILRSCFIERHALSVVRLAFEGVKVGGIENEVNRAPEFLFQLVVDRASHKTRRCRRFDNEVDVGGIVGAAARIASEQHHLS